MRRSPFRHKVRVRLGRRALVGHAAAMLNLEPWEQTSKSAAGGGTATVGSIPDRDARGNQPWRAAPSLYKDHLYPA
jgi:hypothetical protein